MKTTDASRYGIITALALLMAGCSTPGLRDYRPQNGREVQLLGKAVRTITPADVRKDFSGNAATLVVWVGIIKKIEFRETERTIQVAFLLDHRRFDWLEHREDDAPYHLSEKGAGEFTAGWTVNKPTRINYLKSLSEPGDALVVYGTPYSIKNGIVRLDASHVRVLPKEKCRADTLEPSPTVEEPGDAPLAE
jgi:hypothetical protein